MTGIIYGCAVSDWGKFRQHIEDRIPEGRPVITVWRAPTIAMAYNAILDGARWSHPEAVILLHDDLEMRSGLVESTLLGALTDAGVVGVIGAQNVHQLDWWAGDIYGRQETDSGWVSGASADGPDPLGVEVDAVDGSIMALSSHVAEVYRFDDRYDGFHGYDVDFCSQVRQDGIRVRVVDAPTHHHTTLGFKSSAIHASWLRAYNTYRAKWAEPAAQL